MNSWNAAFSAINSQPQPLRLVTGSPSTGFNPVGSETQEPQAAGRSNARYGQYENRRPNNMRTEQNYDNMRPKQQGSNIDSLFNDLIKLFMEYMTAYMGKTDAPKPGERPPTYAPTPDNSTALSGVMTNKDLVTLNTLVGAAGLGQTLTDLEKQGPITILAPTEEAFAALPNGVGAKLQRPENRDLLREVLSYHVQKGAINFDGGPPERVDSLLANDRDNNVLVDGRYRPTFVNDGQIIEGGTIIETRNGSRIIPINEVLLPPGLDISRLR